MNLEKALSILGLSRTYTEEDLKKAYRRLIAKYHPDLYENKSESEKKFAEEKTKDINTAKEYLEKCLKDRVNNKSRNNTGSNYNTRSTSGNEENYSKVYTILFKKKVEFKEKIDDFINDVNSVNDNAEDLLIAVKARLSNLHKRYIIMLNTVRTVFELSVLDAKFYSDIIGILDTYARDYCKKYNITINIASLESYSLKILQDQLEKLIKKKQSDESVARILDELLDNYRLYAGFSVIEKLIINIKNEIEKEYSEGKLNIEEAILKFNNKVSEEFKNYYKRLELINKLKELFKFGNFPRYYDMLIEDLERNIADRAYFWSKAYNFLDAFNQRERTGGTDEITKEEKNRINNNEFESVNNKNYIIKDYNVDKIFSKKKKKVKKNI